MTADEMQEAIATLTAERNAATQRADGLQFKLESAEKRIGEYVERHRAIRTETSRIRAELRWLLQDAHALRNRFEQLVGRAAKLEADNALARTANEASAEAVQSSTPPAAAFAQPPDVAAT